jgi:Entner-Doudoroff aldolase
MNDISKKIAEIGIVPVIKIDDVAKSEALAAALCAGGVPVAEITFRAAGADEAIRRMRAAFPEMLVGAGTVLTTAQVDAAIDAGAQFVVSPGFNPKTVEHCIARGIPIFPGCVTPGEIERALDYGLKVLKFFPAEAFGGLKTIKALAAPFSMVKFMPTGGISLENLGEYAANAAIHACGGSYMVTSALINGEKWDEIAALCRKSVEIISEVRHG